MHTIVSDSVKGIPSRKGEDPFPCWYVQAVMSKLGSSEGIECLTTDSSPPLPTGSKGETGTPVLTGCAAAEESMGHERMGKLGGHVKYALIN